VTPVKCKHFDKVFQHDEHQLWHQVGTKATSPTSFFTKKLAKTKIAAQAYIEGQQK